MLSQSAVVVRYDEMIGRVLSSLPANLLAPDDEEKNVPASALKFYKNASGKSPAQQRKEDSKRGKRLKYDLDAQENTATKTTPPPVLLSAKDPTTVEELRERLKEKLVSAKTARTTTKKRKLDEQATKERAPKKVSNEKKKKEIKQKKKVAKDEKAEEEQRGADVTFPMLKPKKDAVGGRAPGAPGSKTRRLKALAAGAEQKREELNRMKEVGDETADRIEWKEAMQLASGEMKARVDPAKIKKALKSRQKKKEKSKKAWDDRIEQQQKHMALPKKEKRKLDREKHGKSSASKKSKKASSAEEGDKPKKRRKQQSSQD